MQGIGAVCTDGLVHSDHFDNTRVVNDTSGRSCFSRQPLAVDALCPSPGNTETATRSRGRGNGHQQVMVPRCILVDQSTENGRLIDASKVKMTYMIGCQEQATTQPYAVNLSMDNRAA